jgi:cell wall-associated NlpC family hydrolase
VSTNGSRLIRVTLVGLAVALAACSTAARRSPETSIERLPAEWSRVVTIALQYRGAPYRWGGVGPTEFDCSGFVRYVYAQVGVTLPHNAAAQYKLGTPVRRDSLEPGDLVFFDGLRHNGIYIGDGRFIHARRTGKYVAIASLDDDWYRTHWVGARRL